MTVWLTPAGEHISNLQRDNQKRVCLCLFCCFCVSTIYITLGYNCCNSCLYSIHHSFDYKSILAFDYCQNIDTNVLRKKKPSEFNFWFISQLTQKQTILFFYIVISRDILYRDWYFFFKKKYIRLSSIVVILSM